MTIVKVTVKWKTNIYNDLELNINEPIALFKEQLWKITSVPPEKQKLMYKGLIKNDTNLHTLNIKNNDKIMLVGSSELLAEKPDKITFFEDLSKEDKEKLNEDKNIIFEEQGIVNLGNTCYFNAVLQFLTSFNDLGEFLSNIKKTQNFGFRSNKDILFDCYIHFSQTFGKSSKPYVPLELLKAFRDVFPKFKTINIRTKQYAQQDAEECMNAILTSLNDHTESKIIDKLFSFKIIGKIKCVEQNSQDDEPNKQKESQKNENSQKPESDKNNPSQNEENDHFELTQEKHNKLICYMGTQNTPVNHLHEGIRLSLIEKIKKKKNDNDKEDTLYEKKSEIDSLPPYLIIHFLRFESKRIVDTSNTVSVVTAKICRKVSFPEIFDIYDFCSDRIKADLKISRNIIMNRKDIKTPIVQENKNEDDKMLETLTNQDDKNKEFVEIPNGEYELISVITHKGRNEESGHYIAWKKMRNRVNKNSEYDANGPRTKKNKSNNEPTWFKMDDDKVSLHNFSSLDLFGGCSDYNTAVLLLYKRKTISCTKDELNKYSV
ncbi:ubiquitin carboxyl-terminal hydrolase 14, putative [Plasmodium berghei]|uniref:Ubiquitin carboxyl-terminal hydrolase n=2 Tax=Plasmodium berghei TaxID=5821 RepID=A0A509ARH2_PLABA|nr:ubiquitin carboxyl-terminal hydrolase 14, putative [Plasmodium berghei ANKA]CXI83446.1 ubiquitin carboxyl-terminal hydrolase 14, putative [Plasmodium berghei]SCM25708.1 ubiquitin carboxyl-terminal hydrolase 14, putative [Plasmodium berghei]SCN27462.1 ubiquitin carboxyl-terminal hydrolase 14, putative [Plasmodium berghei]SCO62170.1 ubiquitin carboxyl-terminal hydrolase 14, putative [Plasmodium berghei]SCO63889.1 ubiquitin carboxyl-terminal hydrolase 14, putative [Plasmodium berghei]|eukprot:XP_034423094.1 ubiquitin carboxyl-terminal hydrolase 14, putative [Plasmodium berghei ANKA]